MIPPRAEVVVIGGGVIGASIAYHLALRGVQDVVLLERDLLGYGATSKASGAIRKQFHRECEIRLAVESAPEWEQFDAEHDAFVDFQQVGYLYLLRSDADVERFRASVALQRSHGVPSSILSPDDVLDLVPEVSPDGLLGAAYCPTDGRGIPTGALQGYASAARRLGVTIAERVPVERIRATRGRVDGIETSEGTLSCDVVITAAGPHTRELAQTVGIELPIRPRRMHQFVVGPFRGSRSLPCIVDIATTLFIASESGDGLLLGMDREEPESFDQSIDWDFLPEVVKAATTVLPDVITGDLRTAWAGLYDITPDGLPFLGEAQSVSGLYCAAGMNGHGFMLSPAIGRVMAELVVDGASSIDIESLSVDRFATAPATV